MKYYEKSKSGGNAGFYAVIAVCLVAVGAITWFAVSRYNKAQQPSENPSSSTVDPPAVTPIEDEEKNGKNSLMEPEPQTSAEPTEKPVDDVPYEETAKSNSFALPDGKVIKDYSETELQYSETYGDMRLHSGVDIAAALNSEFKSSSAGTVTAVEEDALLGKCVTVDYGGGITAKYCGFENVSVSDGEEIAAGRVLGTVGTVPSECADEAHIHIVIKKDGKIVSHREN